MLIRRAVRKLASTTLILMTWKTSVQKPSSEATEKCSVVAIDEIGPMELYSPKFKQAVAHALESKKLVLAVVHAKARDPLINMAKQRDDAELFLVTLANRDSLPKELSNKVLRRSLACQQVT